MKLIFVAALVATGYSAACAMGGSATAAQGGGFVSGSAIGSACSCGAASVATAFPQCSSGRCVQNAATSATKGFCQTAANFGVVTARTTATNGATCAGSGASTCGGKKTAAEAGTSGNCGYDASNNAGAALKGTVGWFTCMAGKMGNSGLSGTELTNADAWAMAANPTACTVASSAVSAQGGGFVSASALTTACICGGNAASAAKPICSTGFRCVQDLGSSPTKGFCQTAANYALITSKTTALTSSIASACAGSGTTTCGGILALAVASASATGCKWHTSTLPSGNLVGTVAYWDCVAGKLRAFADLSGTASAQKTAAYAYAQAIKATLTPTKSPTKSPTKTPTASPTTAAAGTGSASIASIAAASITAVVASLL